MRFLVGLGLGWHDYMGLDGMDLESSGSLLEYERFETWVEFVGPHVWNNIELKDTVHCIYE